MLLQSSKCTFFETSETFISRELLACAEEVTESLGSMRPQLWPVVRGRGGHRAPATAVVLVLVKTFDLHSVQRES